MVLVAAIVSVSSAVEKSAEKAPAVLDPLAVDAPAVERRLLDDVTFLASDALEGRDVVTKGHEQAADFLRAAFQKMGLPGAAKDGGYFQPFSVKVDNRAKADVTKLTLRGPDGAEQVLRIGVDFQPLAFGGDGKFTAPIVFVGYGIEADEYKYDDYAGLDVAGKVVLAMRREPRQTDEKSVFNGKDTTKYSSLISKAETAWVKKAAAVLFVTEPHTAGKPDDDRLLPVGYVGGEGSGNLPL
ncbi:MAG: hypothetical protein ACRC1K_09845, partial [Planctomycetia bacterium]